MKMKKTLLIGLVTVGIGFSLTNAYAQSNGWGFKQVAAFCATHSQHKIDGQQPNGETALASVLAMKPGKYSYSGGGALLLFPEGYYIVGLSNDRQGTYGTAGDDMLSSGLVAGCSYEQLSEALQANKMTVQNFRLEKRYVNSSKVNKPPVTQD